PVSIDGKKMNAVELIQQLHTMASAYAIGRDVHVGDTIIGIKGRVGFEAPAPLILIKSHQLLEKHILTKWQQYWKDQIGTWYGMQVHEGQFMEPVLRNMEKMLEDSQDRVTGSVFVKLSPYRFSLEGIESKYDMMQSRFGSYGEMNTGWTGEDVKSFTKILGNATRIYHSTGKDEN
ncbi:MAG: argininosuccinate synthase, partial [Cyclobacteriaceae bacterium]|nr:argininosuccinate synthase [Cyclobacteriaceae bacterium]